MRALLQRFLLCDRLFWVGMQRIHCHTHAHWHTLLVQYSLTVIITVWSGNNMHGVCVRRATVYRCVTNNSTMKQLEVEEKKTPITNITARESPVSLKLKGPCRRLVAANGHWETDVGPRGSQNTAQPLWLQ